MSSPDLDTQMARITALLAKAESTDFPDEAKTFTDGALKLMAKYGLDAAVIDAHRAGADASYKREEVKHRRYMFHPPHSFEQATLLYRVFEAMRCKCIVAKRPDAETAVHVFGFESDLRRAQMLSMSLEVQLEHFLAQSEEHRPPFETTASWRRSFMAGFASSVAKRIEEAEREVRQTAEASTELVLVDRQSQVDDAVKEKFPVLKGAKRQYGSGTGYGAIAGKQANISGPAVGGRTRQLGG